MNLPANQKMPTQPLGQEDPLEVEMATHSSILPRKSHGQRSLAGYSPCGYRKSRTRLRGINNSKWHTCLVLFPPKKVLMCKCMHVDSNSGNDRSDFLWFWSVVFQMGYVSYLGSQILLCSWYPCMRKEDHESKTLGPLTNILPSIPIIFLEKVQLYLKNWLYTPKLIPFKMGFNYTHNINCVIKY